MSEADGEEAVQVLWEATSTSVDLRAQGPETRAPDSKERARLVPPMLRGSDGFTEGGAAWRIDRRVTLFASQMQVLDVLFGPFDF